MALLNSYGSANRVVTNDKVVTYSMTKLEGNWTWFDGVNTHSYYWMWEIHRYCTKQYKYVGMDLATAQACAAAKVTLFTRTFKASVYEAPALGRGQCNDYDMGKRCMAEVSIHQTQGHMYEVLINVTEDDSRMRTPDQTTASVDPATFFTAENQRDYDTN